jgi:hypothetical protein
MSYVISKAQKDHVFDELIKSPREFRKAPSFTFFMPNVLERMNGVTKEAVYYEW